ncbi:MAG: glycogen/starch synthase [Candidatus Hydrothermales bacterium]
MKLVYLSAEVYPFSKVGGLADVAGSLPIQLKNNGVDIIVLSPFYSKFIKIENYKVNEIFEDSINFGSEINKIKWINIFHKGVSFYLLSHEDFFGRDYIYVPPTGEDQNQYKRFAFFSLASLLFLKKINFKPDIIHINDWHTSFVPIYLETKFKDEEFFKDTKTLLTIHNLSYQGVYRKEVLREIEIDEPSDIFLKDGNVNFLKAGILLSDYINTVSPTYAKEIMTPQLGYGLDDVLKSKKDKVFGILNGIDYEEWNPETDKEIYKNFNINNFREGKEINKRMLREELSLAHDNSLLAGMVSRLTYQKGVDLLIESFDEFFKRDIQFILLATGEKRYEDKIKEYETKYKEKFRFIPRFDIVLSKKIYAGSDLFLIPSVFEPCGLTQMISMRYGTIPFAYKTGGLADTVVDYEDGGSGFLFSEYNKESFIKKLDKIISVFKIKSEWEKIIESCMKKDFSWEKSAREYLNLYMKIKYEKL